uniref:Uncharacterized protein n=1 Tax=Physcomitrium patens TaxID=3218 RepID=A0A7I4AL88_PHYPA
MTNIICNGFLPTCSGGRRFQAENLEKRWKKVNDMPARRFKAPLARREYSFSVLTHGREERFLLVSPRYCVEETETRVGYRRSRHIGANGHNGKRDKG